MLAGVGLMMVCCSSSSVASMMMGGETKPVVMVMTIPQVLVLVLVLVLVTRVQPVNPTKLSMPRPERYHVRALTRLNQNQLHGGERGLITLYPFLVQKPLRRDKPTLSMN